MTQECQNSKQFFLQSKSGKEVIKDKISELKVWVKYWDKQVKEKYKDWGRCSDDVKWYHDYMMKQCEKKKKQAQKKVKKFCWLLRKANGETSEDELNVEAAKRVPIGVLLSGKPKYKSAGRAKFLCPLHNESTASFTWYKEQNSWYCYGCHKGGDIIELYQELNDCDFKEAVRELNKY